MSTWPINCPRVAPNDRRTAISIVRFAARASNKLAILAQAMRSTIPVIRKSMTSGVRASLITLLCPLRPSVSKIFFALNCARFFWVAPF